MLIAVVACLLPTNNTVWKIDETVRSGYSDCSFASLATVIEEEFCEA